MECGAAFDWRYVSAFSDGPYVKRQEDADQRVLIVGAVIAAALIVIVLYLGASWLRDQHGWGDLICHAKFGDPGFGQVWDRDIYGENVCRRVRW